MVNNGKPNAFKRRSARLVVALVLAMATIATIAAPAQAGNPIVWRPNGWWIPMQYGSTDAGNVKAWLKPSSQFRMICYTDNKWYYGNYWSNRWFWGQSYYNGYWGYVHASFVYYQTSVPPC